MKIFAEERKMQNQRFEIFRFDLIKVYENKHFSDALYSLGFRAHLIFAGKISQCKLVCACGKVFK